MSGYNTGSENVNAEANKWYSCNIVSRNPQFICKSTENVCSDLKNTPLKRYSEKLVSDSYRFEITLGAYLQVEKIYRQLRGLPTEGRLDIF